MLSSVLRSRSATRSRREANAPSPRSAANPVRETVGPRVWLLTNAPSPYQVELLSAVERETDLHLDVRFMRAGHPPGSGNGTSWPFRSRVLAGLGPRRWRDEFRLHPRAVWEVATGSADCFVLSGLYTSMTFLICAAVLTVRRKPWLLWLEQPRSGAYRMRWARGNRLRVAGLMIRNWLLGRLLGFSRAIICIGTAAVEAYRKLGPEPSKLLVLPYCCDVNRFRDPNPRAVTRLRRELDLEGKTVFLYSGQMVQRKGVDVALRAFERIADERDDVALLLLGDGSLRQDLEASVAAAVRDRVRFVGLIDQADLPIYFGAADVFVFPSRHDGWGVVINEACGAGLAVIVSEQTGAARDLVLDGVNGYRVEADDIEGFSERMAHLADDPDTLREFGRRSLERVAEYTVESAAGRFRDVLSRFIRAIE